MIVAWHHMTIDDEWRETTFLGVFSDLFWADRAIKEYKKERAKREGLTEWDDIYFDMDKFEIKDVKINELLKK